MNTGIHKFVFLIHMAIIEDNKSALEMAWGAICKKNINKKIHVR